VFAPLFEWHGNLCYTDVATDVILKGIVRKLKVLVFSLKCLLTGGTILDSNICINFLFSQIEINIKDGAEAKRNLSETSKPFELKSRG
jgi:hypothetical protein